jgi:hypothetical protein
MKKTLRMLLERYPDRIASVDDESATGDGYWLNLRSGWSRWGEVHSVHEWTMKDLILAMRSDVVACDCKECKQDSKNLVK